VAELGREHLARHRSHTGGISRAISVPLATVIKRQQGSLVDTCMARSAPVTAMIPTLPKLTAWLSGDQGQTLVFGEVLEVLGVEGRQREAVSEGAGSDPGVVGGSRPAAADG
jgi:hypothetical protein